MGQLLVPISIGELFDKISILEIKLNEISDTSKKENIKRELQDLQAFREREIISSPELHGLYASLQVTGASGISKTTSALKGAYKGI